MVLRSRTRAAYRLLASEQSGFTLIELVVVLVIFGTLLAIAIPSVLGYRDRAEQTVAAANIRAALPAVLTYYADNGTYVGMTDSALREIDVGLRLDPLVAVMQTATSYCIASTVGATTWRSSSADLRDAVAGACLPTSALACHYDGWRMLGRSSYDRFISEQECVEFALAGGTPVILANH